MFSRTNKAMDLARMMIKQAKLLKKAGLTSEARRLAERAIDMNAMAHTSERAMQLVPVRIKR
ncbi:MAG: hypothetical protein AAFR71_16230 [Pseudomonadota bacterium]